MQLRLFAWVLVTGLATSHWTLRAASAPQDPNFFAGLRDMVSEAALKVYTGGLLNASPRLDIIRDAVQNNYAGHNDWAVLLNVVASPAEQLEEALMALPRGVNQCNKGTPPPSCADTGGAILVSGQIEDKPAHVRVMVLFVPKKRQEQKVVDDIMGRLRTWVISCQLESQAKGYTLLVKAVDICTKKRYEEARFTVPLVMVTSKCRTVAMTNEKGGILNDRVYDKEGSWCYDLHVLLPIPATND